MHGFLTAALGRTLLIMALLSCSQSGGVVDVAPEDATVNDVEAKLKELQDRFTKVSEEQARTLCGPRLDHLNRSLNFGPDYWLVEPVRIKDRMELLYELDDRLDRIEEELKDIPCR